MPEYFDPTNLMDSPVKLIALVVTGVIIGVVGGLFGVGGGFLLTPVLAELFGFPYKMAAGIASTHAVGIAATGLRRHMRSGSIDFRLGFSIAAGAAVGALIGSQILAYVGNVVFAKDTAQQDFVVRVVYVFLLVFVIIVLLKPMKPGATAPLQKLKLGFTWPVPGQPDKSFSGPGAIITALLCGVVCGFLGIGGGVVYMPMLIVAIGARAQHAVRVSLMVVLFSAIGGTIGHAWAQNVSLLAAMMMIVGSSLGVQLGAYICDRLHADKIKKYFIFVVLAALTLIVWKLIAGGESAH